MKHIYRLSSGYRVELKTKHISCLSKKYKNIKNVNKYFSDKKYGSSENALLYAINWRDTEYQILRHIGIKDPTNGRLTPKRLKKSK